MLKYKFVDKKKMAEEHDPDQEEWKWVIKIQANYKRRSRFWTPEEKNQK